MRRLSIRAEGKVASMLIAALATMAVAAIDIYASAAPFLNT